MSPLANLLSRGKDGQVDASIDVGDLTPRPVLVARVNLLPAEIADAEKFRREQVVRAGAVAASVVIVALGALAASHGVTQAQESVDATAARTAELQSEVRSLSDVPLTQAALDTAQAQRTGALGSEVRWSSYLNDLGLQIPPGVQITSMTVAQTVNVAAAPAGGKGPSGVVSATGKPGIASVTFAGSTVPGDRLAFFLEALALQKGNVDPYFSDASEAIDTASGREVVNFNATVTVDNDALSNRYSNSGG